MPVGQSTFGLHPPTSLASAGMTRMVAPPVMAEAPSSGGGHSHGGKPCSGHGNSDVALSPQQQSPIPAQAIQQMFNQNMRSNMPLMTSSGPSPIVAHAGPPQQLMGMGGGPPMMGGMPNMGPMGGMPNMGPMGGMPNMGPMGGMPNMGPMGGMPNMGPMGGMPNMGPMGGMPNMGPMSNMMAPSSHGHSHGDGGTCGGHGHNSSPSPANLSPQMLAPNASMLPMIEGLIKQYSPDMAAKFQNLPDEQKMNVLQQVQTMMMQQKQGTMNEKQVANLMQVQIASSQFDQMKKQKMKEHVQAGLEKGLIPGAKVLSEDEFENSLFYHVIFGDVGDVKALLKTEEGKKDLHTWDVHGFQVVHYASRRPSLKILEELVAAGADVNVTSESKNKETPLLMAIESGSVEVVHFLVEQGANREAKNALGCSPIQIAAQKNALLPLVYFLNIGCDLEDEDYSGHTALHWTAYNSSPQAAKLLLLAGSNPLKTDHLGFTPLHWSIAKDSFDVFEYLYEAEPSAAKMKSKDGYDALGVAAKVKNEKIITYIKNKENGLPPIDDRKDKIRQKLATFIPPFLLVFTLVVHSLTYWWITAILMLSYPYIFITYFKNVFRLDDRNIALQSIIVTSYMLQLVAYFAYILPRTYLTQPISTVTFVILNFVIVEAYRVLVFADPGYLDQYTLGSFNVLEHLKKGKPVPRICETCVIIKPDRSKHCAECDLCVERMDHHCPWSHACVGYRNIFVFFVFISLFVFGQILWWRIVFHSYLDDPRVPFEPELAGYWRIFLSMSIDMPFISSLLAWNIMNYPWVVYVYLGQLYNISFNLTTNEMQNASRYDYFKDKQGAFYNPFDRGILTNWIMIMGDSISSMWNNDTAPSNVPYRRAVKRKGTTHAFYNSPAIESKVNEKPKSGMPYSTLPGPGKSPAASTTNNRSNQRQNGGLGGLVGRLMNSNSRPAAKEV